MTTLRVDRLPPLPMTRLFGRTNDLNEIIRRLRSHPILVVTGAPGVGKTAMVSALSHEPQSTLQYRDGILWTSLGDSPHDVYDELLAWAVALGLQGGPAAISTKRAASAWLRSRLKDAEILMLLDDVWNEGDARPFIEAAGSPARVLITTRLLAVASELAPSPDGIYELQPLTEADSMELLTYLAPTAVGADRAGCIGLIRKIDGLPLTLQVAGRLLEREARLFNGQITGLLAELSGGATLLTKTAPADRVDREYNRITIAQILKRSTDALSAQAVRCFKLLASFSPRPATYDEGAFAATWRVDPKPILKELLLLGLVERTGQRYHIHSLIITCAKSLLDELE